MPKNSSKYNKTFAFAFFQANYINLICQKLKKYDKIIET